MSESSVLSAAGSSITSSDSSNDGSANRGYTLKLRLPKFSKGYIHRDFVLAFVQHVNRHDIENVGRLKYPNEWMVTLSCASAKHKLLKQGVVTIRNKKCVIYPFDDNEVCGKIHWLPADIPDSSILTILRRFGDVAFFEKEKVADDNVLLETSVRFFVMTLKPNVTKETIPHFIKLTQSEGLVTVKGRQPMCFGCKGEHRKVDCKLRKTDNLSKKDLAKKKKRKPKTKSMVSTAQQTGDLTSLPGASSGTRSRNETNQSTAAGASGHTPKTTPAPMPNDFDIPSPNMHNLHEVMNLLSQRLADALSENVAGAAAAASTTTNTAAEPKKIKKKKKKNKKKDPATAADAVDTTVVTTPVAMPVANQIPLEDKPNCLPPQPPVATMSATVSQIVNSSDGGVTGAQKKRKKKKNKKSSNTADI